MGYQESLITIYPEWKFKNLITAYSKLYEVGYYDLPFTAEPLSVIKLKSKIGKYKPGTKFLWVCGDRCFINEYGIFEHNLSKGIQKLIIIPAETLIEINEDYVKGINFNTLNPTENQYMKRWNIQGYVSEYMKREHKKKCIER